MQPATLRPIHRRHGAREREDQAMAMNRRRLLQAAGATAAGAATIYPQFKFAFLQQAEGVPNPLETYPNRDWEQIYRDQYAYDDSFTFVCAPNDTHMCRL